MATKKVAKKAVPATKPTPEQLEDIELAEEQAEKENAKLHGLTADQKAISEYNKGAFQKIDPVTGEKRDTPLPGA